MTLEGAHVLVLSADPVATEDLAVAFEHAGAEPILRFALHDLPDPHDLAAVVVHESAFSASADEFDAYLDALPASVRVLEGTPDSVDRLLRGLESRAARTVTPDTPRRPPGRSLLRAAGTVIVVTIILSIVFGRGTRSPGEQASQTTVPGAPVAGGQANAPPAAGAGVLAGRVVRSDTNAGISGATVVASGPSGPLTMTTDDQGRWRFTGLRGGRYVVMSTMAQYAAKQVQVDVADGGAVENVNLSLDPQGP